ncbi:MAG: SDR family oxidoreductase [Candidatus Eremiobacteraeota bacterium]|jgi:3-oxoacyl-[acyl-carrier protein] reductase|nr:SDR family oxidoreductase [Candidatus Eremiobacteraeota bacterium]
MSFTFSFPSELSSKDEKPCVLVTGGSRGIGRAIVLTFAAAGANLVFTYKSDEKAALETVKEAKRRGGTAVSLQADVSDFSQSQEVALKAAEHFGPPSILINNAGINRDAVIWKMTEQDWDDVLNSNLKGCFNYIRAVSGIFKEEKRGKIVNIASINGLRGKFGQSNYSASKAGIIGLTKTAARELGPYHINVNAIAPGLIETSMAEKMSDVLREQAKNDTVLGQLGKPEDVAYTALFLCSKQAEHITGEVIKVDGGQYL